MNWRGVIWHTMIVLPNGILFMARLVLRPPTQKDDTIYDPVTNRKSNALDWIAARQAKVICSYSQGEAIRIGAENGHYGPWHNVQVLHND
jgi:hypothetical protein